MGADGAGRVGRAASACPLGAQAADKPRGRPGSMSSNKVVAKDAILEDVLPLTQAAYLPGRAYDEMFAPDGAVRPHYELLQDRIASLGAEELAERQRTLERSFLLQGITFTVYGADSATERIIPTDLFPRIIPAEEWAKIEAGLTQRLTRAEHLPRRHLRRPEDPDGRRGAARAGAGRALLPPRDAAPLCAAQRLRQRLRQRPDPRRGRRVRGAGGQSARPLRRLLHAGQPRRRRAAPSPARSARPACGRSSAIPTCCWRR